MPSKNRNRRSVLKMAGGVTTGLALASVGTAAADDTGTMDDVSTQSGSCDCYWESKCDGYCEEDLSKEQYWVRECCDCGGSTCCADWARDSCCTTSSE